MLATLLVAVRPPSPELASLYRWIYVLGTIGFVIGLTAIWGKDKRQMARTIGLVAVIALVVGAGMVFADTYYNPLCDGYWYYINYTACAWGF